eukprot:m.18707 g.18707  ORF g.18707 m.18707 type:complete len:224 (-) comp7426_c0_seq1:308-979(-)
MALRRLATVARFAAASQPLRLPTVQPVRTLFVSRPVFSLPKVLQQEIDDEEQNGQAAQIEPTYQKFQVEHTVGSASLKLTKKTSTESVIVSVNLNDCEMSEGETNEEGEEQESGPVIVPYFTIEIAKNSGDTLVFDCTTSEGKLSLNRVGLRRKGQDSTSKDPVFADMQFFNETLYEEFYSYLDKKGIDEDFVAYFDGLIADKEYSEYVQLLKNIKAFAQGKE